MHLNEDQIQRFLHDELDAREKETVALHVAECNACAQQLALAERDESEIFGLLTGLDHPTPSVDASTLMGRGRGWAPAWGRRAAILVVALGLAGAAYAIPGSPLPAFFKQVASLFTGQDAPPAGDDSTTTSPPAVSGIAVAVQPRFAIAFVAEQSSGVVAIALVDGADVMVRALGGTPTFTADVDRIIVDNRGEQADFEIDIPRDAPLVEILVGARAVKVKDGAQFAPGLPTDARGRAILPLTKPEN
jgi:hypothetical protein